MLTPWIVPSFVVAVLWQFMWQSDVGIVNKVLVDYTRPPRRAADLAARRRTRMWAIVIPSVWRGLPFAMLIFLAGLQAMPRELHEAAAIDGAGPLRRFRYITLPLLRPLIAVQLLFGVIYAAYQFAIPYVMLGSNPGPDADLMMTLIVRQSFSNNLFGFGAAASTLLMLAMFVWVRRLVPRLQARPGGHRMSPPPRTCNRGLDALTWLVLLVMLAPIFWLVASSLQTDGSALDRRLRPAAPDVHGVQPACGRPSTSSATSSTSLIICTVAALLATAFASSRRLRARALPLPRLARRSALGVDRHAADPRLAVPAAGLHRLHLAQAEHADPRCSTPTSG